MATDRAKYRQKRLLAAKIESTTGTAEALLAANAAFIVSNLSLTPDDPNNERQLMGARGTERSAPGANTGVCEFDIDLAGNGAAGMPAWAETFLPPCDLEQTDGVYEVVDGEKTLTLAEYEDGLVRRLYGARGNVRFVFAAGQIAKARFRFIGNYEDDSDASLLSPTLPTVLPPICEGMTTTIGGYTPLWSQIELDLGNQVELREGPASSGRAYYAAGIPNRKPTLTIDPEAAAMATKNWRNLRGLATEAALSIVLGSAANNILTWAATRLQVTSAKPGDRKGFSIYSLVCALNGAEPFTVALT